jgi:hypothetical protein
LNKLDSTDSGRKVLLKRYGSTEATEYYDFYNARNNHNFAFFGNTVFRDRNNYNTDWSRQYQYKNGAFENITPSIDVEVLNFDTSIPQYDAKDSNVTVMCQESTAGHFRFIYNGVTYMNQDSEGWFYIGKKGDKYYIGYMNNYGWTAEVKIYEYDLPTQSLSSDAVWTKSFSFAYYGGWNGSRGWWINDSTMRLVFTYPNSDNYFVICDYNTETDECNYAYSGNNAFLYAVGGFDDIFVVCNEGSYSNNGDFGNTKSFKVYKHKKDTMTELDLLTKYTDNYRVWVNNAAKQIIVCTETNVDVYEYNGASFTPRSYKFTLPDTYSSMPRYAISSPDGRLFAIITRIAYDNCGITLTAINDTDQDFTAIEDSVKEYDYLTFTGITTGNTSGNYVEVKTVMPDTVTVDLTITPDPDEIEFKGEKL